MKDISGPVNATEAKQRMMAMEQQLSQLSQMVTKHKKPGKKSVSFEKSVSFSDDPPSSSGGILTKKDDNRRSDRSERGDRSDRSSDRSDRADRGDRGDRGSNSMSKNSSYSKAASDRWVIYFLFY